MTNFFFFTIRGDRNDKLLRSQVVQVLSNTANGCLTELGYFPGILNQLQKLEQLNAQYKTDIANLHANNCRLQQSLAVHEHTAKFLKAPESTKIQHLKELEGKINFLSEENRILTTQHNSLVRKRQQLIFEYNRLQNTHQHALNEIGYLRGQCNGIPKQAPSKSGGTKGKNCCCYLGEPTLC
jgi:chromosome segregation ATPase